MTVVYVLGGIAGVCIAVYLGLVFVLWRATGRTYFDRPL